MKIKVLGSAAGGGFPQWNCNCPNCHGLRHQELKTQARTQSSLAVSANDKDWLLINASPDILHQIAATPELQPSRALRDSGIAAVLLTDAQLDHVTGLLMLREHAKPLPVYASASVWRDLSNSFPIASILSCYCGVEHHPIPLDGTPFFPDMLNDISLTAVPLRGKAPPYSPNRQLPAPGNNIGLFIRDNSSGRSVFYAPGLGGPEPHVLAAMSRAQLVLVDGTLWQNNEMIELGLSNKTSLDMGHLPLHGPQGMIELLSTIGTEARPIRKVLVHINNSNPILRDDSPERAELTRHGVEVAFDGMTFDL